MCDQVGKQPPSVYACPKVADLCGSLTYKPVCMATRTVSRNAKYPIGLLTRWPMDSLMSHGKSVRQSIEKAHKQPSEAQCGDLPLCTFLEEIRTEILHNTGA
jgi:hypothetical protein